MTRYSILTTEREVFIDANSPGQAKAIFIRQIDPPESFPRDDADRAAYFDRWPYLSWTTGECIVGPVLEAEPEAGS